jgi:hypothetical protein
VTDRHWEEGEGGERTGVCGREESCGGTPREEYVYRMNMGIHDAVERGVPIEYVERYMRPFIPDEKGELVERKTILRFVQ